MRVVVIGGGCSGLMAAVLLAQNGCEVTVCEQHYLPGGGSHSYTHHGCTASPCWHYVGQLGWGEPFRVLLEGAGLGPRLRFVEINPAAIDTFSFGLGNKRFNFSQPSGRMAYEIALCEHFPQQRRAIKAYFDLVIKTGNALQALGGDAISLGNLPSRLTSGAHLFLNSLRTLDDVFDRCGVTDPVLRNILSASCGNHGLPPSRIAAVVHMAMAWHFLEGAYYPLGGGGAVADAFVDELKHHGGTLRLRSPVSKIIVENGRAAGVILSKNDERIDADVVLCTADPMVLYREGGLLPEPYGAKMRERLRAAEYTLSAFTLFGLTKTPLGQAGEGGNTWVYQSDVEAAFTAMFAAMGAPQGMAPFTFVSCPTAKDRDLGNGVGQTLEMSVLAPWRVVEQHAGTRFQRRPADYKDAKKAWARAMIETARLVIPGLEFEWLEIGSPLTAKYFVESHEGALYSIAPTIRQTGLFRPVNMVSPVPGLYQSGAATAVGSIAVAMTTGADVAALILRQKHRNALLRHAGRGPLTIIRHRSSRVA